MGEIIGAIIFWTFIGGFFGAIAVCFIGEEVLARRYKKFYETTEEGKKLYCALYTLDRLGSKHDWLKHRMRDLRDKIDEFNYYFPDECEEKFFIIDMKNEYKEHSEELGKVKDERAYLSEKINKMVAALPKKYKGILEYKRRNAMKCKFYSNYIEGVGECVCSYDKVNHNGPILLCTHKDEEDNCTCFEPKMIEYGSSDVYKEQDEFYKKYCKWCSSSVCTGVDDVEARKGCKYYQHDYKEQIIEEMKLLGATQDEIDLLTVQIVLNGINNNREPKSVAWAILQ